jgi:hypothetical protein
MTIEHSRPENPTMHTVQNKISLDAMWGSKANSDLSALDVLRSEINRLGMSLIEFSQDLAAFQDLSRGARRRGIAEKTARVFPSFARLCHITVPFWWKINMPSQPREAFLSSDTDCNRR